MDAKLLLQVPAGTSNLRAGRPEGTLLLHSGTAAEMLADLLLAQPTRNARGYVVGGAHHSSKLSNADVRQVLAWRAEKVTCPEIARRLGVSIHTVKSISAGRRRTQAG